MKDVLYDVRNRVQRVIDTLVPLPGLIGNPTVNANDNNTAKPGQQDQQVQGQHQGGAYIDVVRPTRFGLFPNGLALAKRHAMSYNSMLSGLEDARGRLDNAIKSTGYIIDNYHKVEDFTLAQFQKILTDPPRDETFVPSTSATQYGDL